MVFRLCLLVHGHVCICSFITGLQSKSTCTFKLTHRNLNSYSIHSNAFINIITTPPGPQYRHLCGTLVCTSLSISSCIIFTIKYFSIHFLFLHFYCFICCCCCSRLHIFLPCLNDFSDPCFPASNSFIV